MTLLNADDRSNEVPHTNPYTECHLEHGNEINYDFANIPDETYTGGFMLAPLQLVNDSVPHSLSLCHGICACTPITFIPNPPGLLKDYGSQDAYIPVTTFGSDQRFWDNLYGIENADTQRQRSEKIWKWFDEFIAELAMELDRGAGNEFHKPKGRI